MKAATRSTIGSEKQQKTIQYGKGHISAFNSSVWLKKRIRQKISKQI